MIERVPEAAVRAGVIALRADAKVSGRYDSDKFRFYGNYCDVCTLIENIYLAMRKELENDLDSKNKRRT